MLLAALGLSGEALAMAEQFARIDPAAAAIINSADWGNPRVVEIELGDHVYTPESFKLERGRATILRLRNVGGHSHDMVGGSLFQAIVIRQVQVKAGRVSTPYVRSVYLKPKHEMEIWFVPTVSGKFTFHCSIPGHREEGMEGKVEIQ
jgi:uncharacterized cupredoxin-like copper-binding protein